MLFNKKHVHRAQIIVRVKAAEVTLDLKTEDESIKMPQKTVKYQYLGRKQALIFFAIKSKLGKRGN